MFLITIYLHTYIFHNPGTIAEERKVNRKPKEKKRKRQKRNKENTKRETTKKKGHTKLTVGLWSRPKAKLGIKRN